MQVTFKLFYLRRCDAIKFVSHKANKLSRTRFDRLTNTDKSFFMARIDPKLNPYVFQRILTKENFSYLKFFVMLPWKIVAAIPRHTI